MIRLSALVILLTALVARADGTATGLPGLPGRAGGSGSGNIDAGVVLQTTGAMTLYVDPTGSNANACTASGASACSTLTGALTKVPFVVKNLVTINVAAGTYTEFPVFNGILTGDGAFNIVGPALTGLTVATGSNTGTLTAATNTQPATYTDSGQTWTVDDLKGAFLVFTSGPANGRILPIIKNTATVITTGVSSGSPAIGNTYQIRRPAAKFTDAVNGVTLQINLIGQTEPVYYVGPQGQITFSAIDFESTVDYGWACLVNGSTYHTIFQNGSRCIGSGAGGGTIGLEVTGGTLTMNNSIAASTVTQGYGAVFGSSFSLNSGMPYLATLNASAFIAIDSQALILYKGTFSTYSGSVVLRSTPPSGHGLLELHGPVFQEASNVNSLMLYCDAPGGAGLFSQDSAVAPVGSSGSGQIFTGFNFYISGCTTGITASGKFSNINFVASGTSTCDSIVTTCIEISNGSYVRIPATTVITGSAPTNEITLDGTSYTIAALSAATPPQITVMLSGSSISQR